MLCCVNRDVKQCIENVNALLGQDYYDSLDSAEQSFIDFKFHELILRGEIMNVVIKEESEHDKHRYLKQY